jgi:Glycosyltransferase family 87
MGCAHLLSASPWDINGPVYPRLPRMGMSRIQRVAASLLFGFALIHVLVTWQVRDRIAEGFPDYTIFYTAGNIVRRGLASRLYDAGLQYQVQREFVLAIQNGRGLLPYNHPPYEALLFVPFTYLPYLPGYVIWGVLNVLIFFLVLWLLRPYLHSLPRFHWAFWLLLPAGFFPVFASLFEGQDSILVLLLYTLAFLDLKRDRPRRAGIWLALALFKFQLVLPFMLLAVLARRWKLVSGFAGTAVALALANSALIGWHATLYYPVFVRQLEKTSAGGAIVPMNMPNLHGLLDAIVARTHSSFASVSITAALSLLILFVAGRTIHQNKSGLERDDLCFSLAVVVSVLVSYHIFEYDWTVLLLPALLTLNYLTAQSKISTRPQQLLLIAIIALFISPLYLIPLARFGHLYGLALLLLGWTWALVGELEIGSRAQPPGIPNSELHVFAQV